MDGTLVDTGHLWFEMGGDLMLDLGIDLPDAALDELHGLDLDAALQLLTDRYGQRLTREDDVTRLLDALEARAGGCGQCHGRSSDPSTAAGAKTRSLASQWLQYDTAARRANVWVTSAARAGADPPGDGRQHAVDHQLP